MKYLVAALAFAATLLLVDRVAADVICLFKSERLFGTNKICYYDCLGSTVAITIDALQLCPLSIRR